MASSSSTQQILTSLPSSSARKVWTYDVFLSFRGEDTRKNFVDHLYTALKDRGIRVFRDDNKLERGKQISRELLKAIEESKFSIIVFSKNYAFSSWCLDELVKIIDCTKETGHIAHPLFYNVDPSDVRKQTGSFAEAFDKHGREYLKENTEKMQRWRTVLSQAANLSGWDSRDRHESEFIKEIVEEMFSKLKHTLVDVDNELVGIDFHLQKINTHLSIETDDVKFLGIYGLGGIGKTTIATEVYHMISNRFEGCSYLADIRENSKKHGLIWLQERLLKDISNIRALHSSNPVLACTEIKNSLCHKRVLVILDDVDDIDQLVKLAGKQDWFGSGSRIIITTRDEHLLVAHGVVESYKVMTLKQEESLELFSWKAFKQNYPPHDYMELSYNVVNYAQGLPLALKVLGSFLCGRSKIEWNSALDKLTKVPKKEITDVLKISYDALEQTDKDIFLHVACFFKGKDKGYVMEMLDSCGLFTYIGIQVLNERSLISMSDNNEIMMHDLVQDMGRDIVRQEATKDPGKRSRLWCNEDIRHVLMNNLGTEAVEAIMLEYFTRPNEVDLHLSAEAFMRMYNLRLLKLRGGHLPRGLNNLPDELRILHWQDFPLNYLPSSFRPDKLVKLNMHGSRIKQIWSGMKVLENLKSIDLSWSKYLTEIPDLEGAPLLEQLILDGCTKLFELHPSVGLLKSLKYLSLRSCTNLRSLPSRIELESLETLDLSYCTKLARFPKLVRNMDYLSNLNLEGTAIKNLPSSIENFTCIKLLNLSFCRNLVSLSSGICRLKFLEELLLVECSKLEKLPENLRNLESLMKLDASGTAIKEVPPSIVHLKNLERLSFSRWRETSLDSRGLKLHSFSGLCSLKYLDLSDCKLSDGAIPSDIGNLSSLETLLISGNNFVNLPSSISQLSRLTTLRLEGCEWITALPELPSSIQTLIANDCTSLERLSNLSTVFEQKNVCFGFVNCRKLLKNPSTLTDAVQQFQKQALSTNSETFTICLPGNGMSGWFSHQNTGSSVDIPLPPNWYKSKLRGLAYCIIVPDYEEPVAVSFGFGYTMETDGSGGIMKNDSTISYRGYGELMYAHVMLGYISRAWLRENEERQPKVTFRFKISSDLEVKKCGIRLVYEDDDDDDDEKDNYQFRSRSGESEKPLTPSMNGTDALLSDEELADENHPFKRMRI